MDTQVYSACIKQMKGINDALDVVSGKWKIRILAALSWGPKRFVDLQLIIDGIGTKMLAKELQDLEINGLIARVVTASRPVVINYEVTSYGLTLKTVIKALSEWGNEHRKKVMGGNKQH
jgi:DNA-binding HxlR family transcriptional regulator